MCISGIPQGPSYMALGVWHDWHPHIDFVQLVANGYLDKKLGLGIHFIHLK